jgi:hypothetical protein
MLCGRQELVGERNLGCVHSMSRVLATSGEADPVGRWGAARSKFGSTPSEPPIFKGFAAVERPDRFRRVAKSVGWGVVVDFDPDQRKKAPGFLARGF